MYWKVKIIRSFHCPILIENFLSKMVSILCRNVLSILPFVLHFLSRYEQKFLEREASKPIATHFKFPSPKNGFDELCFICTSNFTIVLHPFQFPVHHATEHWSFNYSNSQHFTIIVNSSKYVRLSFNVYSEKCATLVLSIFKSFLIEIDQTQKNWSDRKSPVKNRWSINRFFNLEFLATKVNVYFCENKCLFLCN